MKNRIIEVFNATTGKWESETVTQEEYEEMKTLSVPQKNSDVLQAEFEIVQRSLAMQLGKQVDKSMD